MNFYVKQQDLQHKDIIVVGVHVISSTEHTTYSSTIKYVSVRLMILIATNNGLGLMSGNIWNTFCMTSCAKNIFSCCGTEFIPRYSAVVLLIVFMD